MNYQKIMQKIMEQLTAYKGEVDEIALSYMADKAKHEKELKDMEGKYTPEYIEENRKNWKPKADYGKIISLARETHGKIAENYLDKAKSELDRYFQIPVDNGFAATVTAVKALGVTLNNREFEALQGASGGYWGLRLLNELGVSRATPEQRTVLENGEPKAIEGERKTPYPYVNLPNIEAAYNTLQGVTNAVNMAFNAYCGKDYALKDFVFPRDKAAQEANAKIAAEYGVTPPEQKLDNMQISRMATSTKCFDENYHCYTEFSELMGNLAATMPKPKKKEALTDDDKTLIDKLINPNYPMSAKDEAVTLAKLDGHLAELLRLDSRYGAAVKEALGEVSENE